MNPVIYERTKDGETFYDIQSRLIKDRVIYLSEPVTNDVAAVIVPLLFMMNNENKEEKISIWINSPGGDAYAFLAIYDMMQMVQAPIETVCIGKAMSAGALLMAAGTKGKRIATPHAKFMIHQMQVSLPDGAMPDLMNSVKSVVQMNNEIIEIFARHTGHTLEKVLADCDRDLELTAEEAIKYGIIDKIVPASKTIPPLKTASTKVAASKKVVKKVSKNRK